MTGYSDEFARYVIRSVLRQRLPVCTAKIDTAALRQELVAELNSNGRDWPWHDFGVPVVPNCVMLKSFGLRSMPECFDGERWSLGR